MDRTIVILAGGISSRMRKALSVPLNPRLRREAEELSKSMIGVGEGFRPFLDYVLFNVREAGYRDVVIVIGERDNSIREYYGKAERGNEVFGLSVSYAIQRIPLGRGKPLGTADALLQALGAAPQWRGRKFTVCNSDNLYSVEALRLMLASEDPGAMIDYDRAALEFDQAMIEQFAVTRVSARGFLVDILEKPHAGAMTQSQDGSGRIGVSMNLFRLSYDLVLPFLESVPLHPLRLEKELPAAIQMMVRKYPESVRAIPMAEHVPDLTSQSDIPRVQEYLRRTFPPFTFEARPARSR